MDENKRLLRVRAVMLSMQRLSWEQGVAAQALYESGDKESAYLLARDAVNRQTPDGRTAMTRDDDHSQTDPCAIGEVLVHAANAYPGEFSEGLTKLTCYAKSTAKRDERGVVYHATGREHWSDSAYMLPPFLAAIGEYDDALRQIFGYKETLFDEQTGLLRHIWSDETKSYKRIAFWGGGIGWTLAALARLRNLLPESRSCDRLRVEQYAALLISALLKYKTVDGMFHDVVDDSSTFDEVNLSQMLAYTLYSGMADGWLPPTFLPVAEELYTAAGIHVNDRGFVRRACGSPTFNKPGVSAEAQAFFILMSAARTRFPASAAYQQGVK
jgi:rhamnogalacturonyl hydrolase YesR